MARILSMFFHPDPSITAVGGAERRFIKILKFFGEREIVVNVFEPKHGLLTRFQVNCETYESSGILPYSKEGWIKLYINWITWALGVCIRSARIAKKRQYDLILVPNHTLPNLISGYFTHLVSHLPLCVVVHYLEVPSFQDASNFFGIYRMYRETSYGRLVSFLKATAMLLTLFVLKRSDVCISVSGLTSKALEKAGVSREKIRQSGNGVDVDYINSFKYEGKKLYDGVFLGRISKEKGVFDLVEVWLRVLQERPNARIILIGSGAEVENLKRRIQSLDLERRVIVKGRRSDEEAYLLMKTSKVFVFPSLFEGWGLSVAEALACGLPVVCYDIPAIREIFGKCRSVFLVPTKNVGVLAEKILKVLGMSEKERKELDIISRAYVSRFTWKEVGLTDLQIIKSMLKRKHVP